MMRMEVAYGDADTILEQISRVAAMPTWMRTHTFAHMACCHGCISHVFGKHALLHMQSAGYVHALQGRFFFFTGKLQLQPGQTLLASNLRIVGRQDINNPALQHVTGNTQTKSLKHCACLPDNDFDHMLLGLGTQDCPADMCLSAHSTSVPELDLVFPTK